MGSLYYNINWKSKNSEKKTDLKSGRNRESGNVEHVAARTMQDQYIGRVVILVTFNLVCLEKLREKIQQKL